MRIVLVLLLLALVGCANGEPLSVPRGKWEPINTSAPQQASAAR